MYAPIVAGSRPGVGLEPQKRRAWLWLAAVAWVWILVASLRAGGDQWDNPRYRVILLAFQSLLAAEAWFHWRASGNAWMKRILAVEGISILVIGYWYVTRYLNLFVHLGVRNTLAIAIALAMLVFAGGWLWDRWRAGRRA
jgi:peptidoglycan/LPS O-acetylase OafA/YrhL